MTLAPLVNDGSAAFTELGPIRFRLLSTATATAGSLGAAVFTGDTAGSWTVPHVHRESEESFYVLDGSFVFTLGDEERSTGPGSFVWVPRGTRHQMRVGEGGGRLLVLWTPAGLEAMFTELSRLPPDSIRDPAERAALAARFDSIPVT